MKKVLIIGGDSFTGYHLQNHFKDGDYIVFSTSFKTCDITQKEQLEAVLKSFDADYVVCLAAISHTQTQDVASFYNVNVLGTLNILEVLVKLSITPKKVLLASSAAVYGNQNRSVLDETLCPQPVNHYGASKYTMECLSKSYSEKLPIITARPFNYTGIQQTDNFLIPKIVSHFRERKPIIELGNLNVIREFNDVEFVCNAYEKLLNSNLTNDVFNIASNRGIKLLDIIEMMNEIAGYRIEVKINPSLVRSNETPSLVGSSKKLFGAVGTIKQKKLYDTLKSMFIQKGAL